MVPVVVDYDVVGGDGLFYNLNDLVTLGHSNNLCLS